MEENYMTIGQITILIVTALIAFGVCQRVLDKMRLTDRQALLIALFIFIGSFLPDIPIGNVRINIGGAVIPFLLCAYLIIGAHTASERVRAVTASLVTAAAVIALGRFFPNEPEAMPFDINYLYGLAAGAIACLFGRSRRAAFIAGALGVMLADIAESVALSLSGVSQTLHLGGAGAMDVIVIAAITAVLIKELVGEFTERVKRGAKDAQKEASR
ncbi:MAG: DUF1614 domain-containing protein [Clostridiales bacterium]|nr:DUF1614 domain-containing protein [Clostridiales bacterium]